jgi:hypothetical protein
MHQANTRSSKKLHEAKTSLTNEINELKGEIRQMRELILVGVTNMIGLGQTTLDDINGVSDVVSETDQVSLKVYQKAM